MPDFDELKNRFTIGETVKVDDEGYTGTIQLINLSTQEVWLDMSPGATSGYFWCIADFPHSWAKDGPTLHAINIFPFSKIKKLN